MPKLLGLIKTLARKMPSSSLLATGVATLVALPFELNQAWLAVLLMVIVMALQAMLDAYEALYDWLLPLEWFDQGSKSTSATYTAASPWLALLPLVHAVFWPLGWLGLSIVCLWLAPPVWRLAKCLLSKDQLKASHLQRLAEHKARIAVHLSGSARVAYQVNQWLPVLEALAIPTVIVVRKRYCIEGIAPTTIPVVYASKAEHLELALGADMRTVLYPGNAKENAVALRHYKLNHFFINHGESDKVVNQSKLLMAYDKLLVGGPLAEARLRTAELPIRDGQIAHVGRPQAEMLLKPKTDNEAPLRTILYAPTWEGFVEGADYTSIGPQAIRIFEQLAHMPKYHILFKAHPYTGLRKKRLHSYLQQIKTLCDQGGHEYIDPQMPIHDLMNRSDIMITDISSVITDYLVTHKPIILCLNERLAHGDIADDYPSSTAAYQLGHDGSELGPILEQISNGDPLAKQREETKRYILGDFEDSALQRFKSVVEGSIQ